jgi:hypothetical protein
LTDAETLVLDAVTLEELVASFRAQDRSYAGACFSSGASVFRGVSWEKGAQKWKASMTFKGKRISLGSFADEVEAARAYDSAAWKLLRRWASCCLSLLPACLCCHTRRTPDPLGAPLQRGAP